MSEQFSNISRKELMYHPEKYINIPIEKEYLNDNFYKLLQYIDRNVEGKSEHPLGNAYFRIRKEANKLLGVGKGTPRYVRTSKREIRSIRQSFKSILQGDTIKIPYKISYIFKAIILILDDIEEEIPNELHSCIGLMYSVAFYSQHISVYRSRYSEIASRAINEPGLKMKKKMIDEFESGNSVFNTRFVKR
jgi:hypothetical protein